MKTLEEQLQKLHDALYAYRHQHQDAPFLYVVTNEAKNFFGLADREGNILHETTREAFYKLNRVFHLLLLRSQEEGTVLLGLKAKDMERVDPTSGLTHLELLVSPKMPS